MLKKLLIILFLASPLSAQAEWVAFSFDNKTISYTDPTRFLATNPSLGYAEAWIKLVPGVDIKEDGLLVGDHRLMKFKIKCKSEELAIVGVYNYRKDILVNSFVEKSITFEPIVPRTVGDTFSRYVCGQLYK
ncbi:hypothetical protein [Acinetobacter indicus]|uniref:hypothetical protein n=1 Tax=Acinetobacter indicus TaxID=756892 RepID=UPI002097E849|nr:hypothetical protein [Acinetobacter indicus]MCO8109574.1 hypothetical protein [Acinetobacter indicus]